MFFNKKIKGIIGLGVLLLVAFSTAAIGQQGGMNFHFVVLGDTRPHGGANVITQPKEFKENIRAINLIMPDFVIDVGDLIHGYIEDEELIDKEWDDFDKTVAMFKIPLHMVIGNHDVWNKKSEDIYRKRYGDLYYSFDHKGSHFIVLDSEEFSPPGAMDYIKGEQLNWLKRDLEEHKDADNIFVFLHKPLWRFSNDETNWNTEVHPLLARYKVRAVFAGHWHVYEKSFARDGIEYFITGGGGAEISESRVMGGFYHFMLVSVRDKEVEYAVIEPEGVKNKNIVTQEFIQNVEKIAKGAIPVIDIRPSETIKEEVTHFLVNPFPQPIEVEVITDTSLAGSWKINPIRSKYLIPANDSIKATFCFSCEATQVFPLPSQKLKVYQDGKEIMSTSPKLKIKNEWFIKEWMVIGPFDLEWRGADRAKVPPGFDKVYPPEKEINLKKSYSSLGKKVSWFKCTADERGFVNLNKLFEPNDDVIAYALAYVYAPKRMKVALSLGSDDGAKIWLNDKLVFRKHIGRGAAPDQDVMIVTLEPGWNKLLLKIEEMYGQWGFYLRFSDTLGVLRYSVKKSK
ncbi:hypothetical protein DRQ12_08675 [candidate division KSB1 bacterium]|nr:MAG: hypothetical protein DRQ12_08675 [candidate division KSB1 bacterium]